MATLNRHDLEQIEKFLRGLYRIRRRQRLIGYVLRELPALVGTNQVSWNSVVPALQQADVMAWPEQTNHDKYQSALARRIREHPLIVHFFETGDPGAYKLSDFLSSRQFHNTALYDELYRGLCYEDHFAMNLQPLGPQWDTVVVAREKRTFTERDRLLLNVLRPHLALAYRQARVYSRLARRLDACRGDVAVSRIVLDSSDAVIEFPARAQRWVEWYFDDLPATPRHLSNIVRQWLSRSRVVRNGKSIKLAAQPLIVSRFGRQLIIRLELDEQPGCTRLLLEERTDGRAAPLATDLNLTPRELQVLLEVEKGKHNSEIAAALGMRLRTVKKHLEHIFDKLGVDNRTAAVWRLHEAMDEMQGARPK